MSAPVRFGPQRYFPLSGDVLSCCSRKQKWVLKLGSRKPDWILEATPEVMGLMKKGTEEFLISVCESVCQRRK